MVGSAQFAVRRSMRVSGVAVVSQIVFFLMFRPAIRTGWGKGGA